MNKHEKLKEICDKIGYEIYFDNGVVWNNFTKEADYWSWKYNINVREIIFTQEFMDKYIKFIKEKWILANSYYKLFLIDLHKNLDNPVDHLYTLIKE